MTAGDGRHGILSAESDEAHRIPARSTEGIRLEFIDGRIRSRALPDGSRACVIEWLTRLCIQSRPELWLYPAKGLRVQQYGKSRARPDGALAPSGADRPGQLRGHRLQRARWRALRGCPHRAVRQADQAPRSCRDHAGHRAAEELGALTRTVRRGNARRERGQRAGRRISPPARPPCVRTCVGGPLSVRRARPPWPRAARPSRPGHRRRPCSRTRSSRPRPRPP